MLGSIQAFLQPLNFTMIRLRPADVLDIAILAFLIYKMLWMLGS